MKVRCPSKFRLAALARSSSAAELRFPDAIEADEHGTYWPVLISEIPYAGERDCRQAFAVESLAVRLEIEVQVVIAVLLAMAGQVSHVGGNQVQKERCLRVGAGARLLDEDQTFRAEIDVEDAAGRRSPEGTDAK